MVVDGYTDSDCFGLWRHENPQDPTFARSRNGFVATFANCTLLWVSKLQTEIAISTIHSEYVALSHYVRALIPLKTIIKEVIENLGIDSETLKSVSRPTVYEDNNGAIVVSKFQGRLLHQITLMSSIIVSGSTLERNL